VEYECPVCNGLADLQNECPRCGGMMTDAGNIENYYGPYSPYDDTDLYEPPGFAGPADVSPCIHLFSCPGCGYDTRIAIARVAI